MVSIMVEALKTIPKSTICLDTATGTSTVGIERIRISLKSFWKNTDAIMPKKYNLVPTTVPPDLSAYMPGL